MGKLFKGDGHILTIPIKLAHGTVLFVGVGVHWSDRDQVWRIEGLSVLENWPVSSLGGITLVWQCTQWKIKTLCIVMNKTKAWVSTHSILTHTESLTQNSLLFSLDYNTTLKINSLNTANSQKDETNVFILLNISSRRLCYDCGPLR